MINLRVKSEYSFRRAFAPIQGIVNHSTTVAGGAVALTDSSGTWGHVPFYIKCKKAGVKPILGVEIAVVGELVRDRQLPANAMTFLAMNNDGLKFLYELVTASTSPENFYYYPRITYAQAIAASFNDIIVLSGVAPKKRLLEEFNSSNLFLEATPIAPQWSRQAVELSVKYNLPLVATSVNCYLTPDDEEAYNYLLNGGDTRIAPQHLLSESELRSEMTYLPDAAFLNTHHIADRCDATLPKAEMVRYPTPRPLIDLCLEGAERKCPELSDAGHAKYAEYKARLDRELKLIEDKQFEDYFYVIADMIQVAKRTMLVGPSRGSSAGSLVCYLLDITEVDPIKYDLIFERFIDITRADLPDIDIDFPDKKRDKVIKYLKTQYGDECVAHIGTISRYKPKSAIGDVAKSLGIPAWETKDLKNAIIERSGGDARASFCIKDTLETLEQGKAFIAKYPEMLVVTKIEGHARHTGKHAAGILVTEAPVRNYASIDLRDGIAQLDKYDTEALDLLKIDVLGLRTLSVLEEACDLISMPYADLYRLETDDKAAFGVFNKLELCGIFQFEGFALRNLTHQMGIQEFNDIVAITSLARPGPLHCGGADAFINRRIGKEEPTPIHPSVGPYTTDTQGTIVYQEQVMEIGRQVGQLSWEDVSALRKAMSKSLGEEFFNKYWELFRDGARKAHNIPEKDAKAIWENMCTFGSWAFNKSHAVSYALISYWCAWFKAHHPLEFAVGCLNNAKGEEQVTKLLRELVEEGFKYKAIDPERSGLKWVIDDGKLIGPLTNIKGIGVKGAQTIIKSRKTDDRLSPSVARKLLAATTPFDDVFPGKTLWGDMHDNPSKHNITGVVSHIKNVHDNGEYVVIAKLMEKNLRDLNEYGNLAKRGGKRIERLNLFLNTILEDDTDMIYATIPRHDYPRMGKPIVEHAAIGDWYLIRGEIRNNWRKLYITKVKKLTPNQAQNLESD